MRERIIQLRKMLNLKQREFAMKIGVKTSVVSNIEAGQNGITDANIKLICMTFHVNEKWLRTGFGEIFNKKSPYIEELISVFEKLTSETQKSLLDMAEIMLKNQDQLLNRELTAEVDPGEEKEAHPIHTQERA